MPRSSKNKKTCFSRKELRNKVRKGVRTTIRRVIRRAVQTRRKKLSKILRKLNKQKGGNYTTDATVMTMGGEPIKAPNTVVVATSDGQVMSVSALQRSLDSLST